jgi:hypothetical protein
MNVMIDDWVQFNVEGELTQKRVTGIQDNGKYIQTINNALKIAKLINNLKEKYER